MCSVAASQKAVSVAEPGSNAHPDGLVTERLFADGVAMVQLLGPQDRLLRVVEREHPDVDVHVRGNEITLVGEAAAVAAARDLVEELLTMTRTGQDLAPADVSSSNRILRSEGNICSTSPVSPLLESAITTSPSVTMPRSP